MTRFEKLYDAILNGNKDVAAEVTREALAQGDDPQELIDTGMIPAMREAGQRFEDEEFFVPELLLAARAMKSALELLKPHLVKRGAEPRGCVVIGTVKGDLHDIGKNLVSSLLEGAGFRVVDLGTDVSPERFAQAVQENSAGLIGLSALLTVTMPAMQATIQALEKAGVRDRVKVLVGGAPLTEEYARQIGADAYADNASAAVRLAERLVGG
jgi:corrinoid protein of di/trimethylamine methyltransferase